MRCIQFPRSVGTRALIGTWVGDHVSSPVVVGPDEESTQWVRAVWSRVLVEFCKERMAIVMSNRSGARDEFRERTPVLFDDIISSGATMIGAAKILEAQGWPAPYCIAVHALFDATTATHLTAVARAVLTTDTVTNSFSHFRVAPLIAAQIAILSA